MNKTFSKLTCLKTVHANEELGIIVQKFGARLPQLSRSWERRKRRARTLEQKQREMEEKPRRPEAETRRSKPSFRRKR